MSPGVEAALRPVRRVVLRALVEQSPRNHRQGGAALKRRRAVVALFLVLGAIVLGFSLAARPGDNAFYWLTALTAVTWTVGGLLSGPLYMGRTLTRGHLRRPIATPIAIGVALGAVFVAGAFIVREIPPVRDYIANVLDHASHGAFALVLLVTAVNGVAEELFFRGGLYAAIPERWSVPVSTALYICATAATGNPMLVFAAALLGIVFALERRASGGVLASILTHITWSGIMVTFLPHIFAR
jgi:membrane protease YdiL (CAAX protease family)